MQVELELARYVVRFYSGFLTNREALARRHLSGTLKATRGGDDVSAQAEARNHVVHAPMLSEDPEVLILARDGYDAFVLRAGRRIFAEHKEEIAVNRCPKCGRLARTPRAKQCQHCFHDWHCVES